MVAAGSIVAAVEGLQMRVVGSAEVSQKLTEQLAQIIRSDPVGTPDPDVTLAVRLYQTNLNSSPFRTVCGRARSRSRHCWRPVSDRLSSSTRLP